MRPFLVSLTVALLSSPALADWQYTRWGMTPGEVQTAAKGRLKENLNPGYDVDDEEAKLKGTYRAQSIDFETYFQFRGDRLSGVSLNAEEGSCFTLHHNLRYTYGTGQRQDVANVIETERWKDEANGNNVQYTKIGGTSCSVRYTPLTRANEPGGL